MKPEKTESRPWKYFRAGGVIQVDLRDTDDLKRLAQLDQKLWMALAMPVSAESSLTETLNALDTDGDKRVRPPEILAAVSWLGEVLSDPGLIFTETDGLELSTLKEPSLLAAAKKVLRKELSSNTVQLAQVDACVATLDSEPFNGDGVITPASCEDPAVANLVADVIAASGGVPDRAGGPGLNSELVDTLAAALQDDIAWKTAFSELKGAPFGNAEQTLQILAIWRSVDGKISDYFTRCHVAAYDSRRVGLDSQIPTEGSPLNLDALEGQPLASPAPAKPLPLGSGLNPAWKARIDAFVAQIMKPLLGVDAELSEAQWQALIGKLAPLNDWAATRPQNLMARLTVDSRRTLEEKPEILETLRQIIAHDLSLDPEYSGLSQLRKALLLKRDLAKILRNLVNFSDFYGKKGAIFLAGNLYIDGRMAELCIDVADAAKHALLAALSGAYLMYCDCTRAGMPPRHVVALITNGDSDSLCVGRRGVFYDKDGKDWDACVTKIVANPISLRAAFWSPYKKFIRFVEEQIAKRAAASEAANTADLGQVAEKVADVSKPETAAALPANLKKVDVGTVAALGVAMGSIGTFLGLIFSKFLDLGLLMPLGIIALILLISGPSMLLAYLKLRNRNLGPILDANGWAVNTRAVINVPFAASMTKLRAIPLGLAATLVDPYAEKKRPWKFYIFVLIAGIIALAIAWRLGSLNRILPESWEPKAVLKLG